MADSFRASFVLKLQDDLSGGLRRIMEDVRRLRDLAKSMGFDGLAKADDATRKVRGDVEELNRTLGGTVRAAEGAAQAMGRMGAAGSAGAAATVASLRRQAALAQQAAAAAGVGGGSAPIRLGAGAGALALLAAGRAGGGGGYGGGGGSGGALVPADEPFGGGIPLNFGAGARAGAAFAGMRAGLGNLRTRFNEFHSRVGLAEGAMAGISLMEPIRQAAEFDNVLTHIAITAGATSDTVRGKVAQMAETYRAMALASRQSSHDVAESAQFLITTGIGEQMTNALLPIIARAATAYNTPMRDAVQGAFSMHEELRIAPEEMGAALSRTALAAKQGHFSFADFSSFLPAIAAQAGVAGIRGLGGLDVLLASLETSRRGAGTSGQAATNLQDFLSYINAPIGMHSFRKAGIDLAGLKVNAERAGQNPIEAVIEAVRRRTAGMSDAQRGTFLGAVFHNQEARIFAQTMLQELQYYEETKKKISEAGDQTIDEDFRKAQNLYTRLRTLSELSAQLTQRVGLGFSWVVPVGNALLGGMLAGLSGIDKILPGVSDGIIGLTGGMLGLVAVMGVLGAVAGPVRAGFLLLRGTMGWVFSLGALRALVNPYTAIILGLTFAIRDVVESWAYYRRSFYRLWGGMLQVLHGAYQYIWGTFTGNMSQAVNGLIGIWNGLKQTFHSLFDPGSVMEGLMNTFADWVDSVFGAKVVEGFGRMIGNVLDKIIPFVKEMQERLDNIHLPDLKLPDHPFMVPPNLDKGPDAFPKYEPHPIGPKPSAYFGNGAGGAQRIHITFESDIPGRASIRDASGNASVNAARGPMLSRV